MTMKKKTKEKIIIFFSHNPNVYGWIYVHVNEPSIATIPFSLSWMQSSILVCCCKWGKEEGRIGESKNVASIQFHDSRRQFCDELRVNRPQMQIEKYHISCFRWFCACISDCQIDWEWWIECGEVMTWFFMLRLHSNEFDISTWSNFKMLFATVSFNQKTEKNFIRRWQSRQFNRFGFFFFFFDWHVSCSSTNGMFTILLLIFSFSFFSLCLVSLFLAAVLHTQNGR